MIVDTSYLVGYALSSYFEKLHHTVVGITRNTQEAKTNFLINGPELVTLEHTIPNCLNFLNFLDVYNQETGLQTRILVVSSKEVSEEIRSKVDISIIKPVTLEMISNALKEINL